jgi:Flp pilus assembly protein TadG
MRRLPFKIRTRQSGVAAIEFSLVAILFFTVVFATMELARLEFLLNTLEEVTRRAAAAAANVDYRDTTAMQSIQADAVFRKSAGSLPLGDPVSADNVKIDYLSVSNTTWDVTHMSTLPACPAGNRSNCMTDPDGANCIRFVRARV